jgi:hypothetical protein
MCFIFSYRSLNEGYNGQILSTDEYFKDVNLNEYLFDSSKLEKAHFYNRRLGFFFSFNFKYL